MGIVAFMLLSGRPPFVGNSKEIILEEVNTKEIEFPKKYWKNKSEECIDFIKKALDKNPKTRSSAEELLQHQWILENSSQSQIRPDILEEVG